MRGWGSGQCASGSEGAGTVCWDQERLPAGFGDLCLKRGREWAGGLPGS